MTDDEDEVNSRLQNAQRSEECIKFEDIMEDIGSNGKFQKRLNIIFNCVSVIFNTTSSYSKLIAITVPDHWCHVPGREAANFSVEAWKNLTIPREDGEYSKCLMYKDVWQGNETVPCMHGWDYDESWFSATVTSQENWVCEKDMYPNMVFSVSLFISIVFGVLLFYGGDRFGRRKQYLVSTGMIAVSRTMLTVSSSVFPLYIFFSVMAEAAGLPSTDSALALGIELTDVRHRSTVNFLSFFSYCIGTIAMALLAWVLRNWVYFILAATLPLFVPIFLIRYLPESPRWYISKGHPEEALKVLQHIAKVNGKPVPQDMFSKLNILSQQRSPNMSVKTIFTNKNLFKNTVLLMCGKSASALAMFTLLFSNTTFGENPFLAYIAQGILQIPAVSVAHFVGNVLGRRITHCLTLLIAGVLSIVMIFLPKESSPAWMVLTGSLLLQFCSHCSVSLTNLQSMEIHPTCIRQISLAMEYILLTCVHCLPPYLAHLEKVAGPQYMFSVLASVLLITSFLVSFVPESLNEKLPETVEDAALYGRSQKYWSFPKKKRARQEAIELCKCVS
ncbi:solute carrier family 22 member 7-like isoform X1 [Schistocerca serialis cubense]|uniref:solute carrier family 22 member 7-like isoform X1 n=1 Tax=Schistocerca serialis cubense TaxID=2023355 RepID=UPI00214EC92D|nr:solute carrier family 22 member 7-like isoform X1 [Schistocerca serialis cubense]